MDDMLKALKAAQENYEEAKKRAEYARRAETDCLNTLNEAQKAFDEGVSALKLDAPEGSDWKRPK